MEMIFTFQSQINLVNICSMKISASFICLVAFVKSVKNVKCEKFQLLIGWANKLFPRVSRGIN